MDRRDFLQIGAAGAGLMANGISGAKAAPALIRPVSAPLSRGRLEGATFICEFSLGDDRWKAYEDLRTRNGAIIFVSGNRSVMLEKRLEPTFDQAEKPYFGMTYEAVARAGRDLLADRLLENGEPDPSAVRDAAPPPMSAMDPQNFGGSVAWNTFIGSKVCSDTMPVFLNGRTRTYRPEFEFPALWDEDMAKRRWEGLIGGWLPAVHKVLPVSDTAYYDVMLFGDVEAPDPFVAQSWHRTMLVENGRITKSAYGYSFPSFPPRRQPPPPEAFFRALLVFAAFWQHEIKDAVPADLPREEWGDMVRHAFAKEVMIRPGGTYPKYGAVNREYHGCEYDGFQDTFTSSLYANLEWGRFDQARAVLDGYLTDFVEADGMVRMRGPEVPQFGLSLSLAARYLRYTGDRSLLRQHKDKLIGWAEILTELHDESLRLPKDSPGHGLIHGWSESDSCLFESPQTWWQPYFSNSAFAARGLMDIAAVWPLIDRGGRFLATRWRARAETLRKATVESIEKNIRRDMEPPYLGPLPGVDKTFRDALETEDPSPQKWPHRVYAELLHADILPDDMTGLVIDCLRSYGGTTLGVVANVSPSRPKERRSLLGFISYGYAQQLLRLDRVEEYLLFLYSHRYHVHAPGSWVAGEVVNIDGSKPYFCIPAQLTIPLLVRWMLVFEDSDKERLHLARAVPRDWLLSGKPVAIESAPTRWGRAGFRLQADKNTRRISGMVEIGGKTRPEEVYLKLRVPPSVRITGVTINGRPAGLGGRRGDVVVLDSRAESRFTVSADYDVL